MSTRVDNVGNLIGRYDPESANSRTFLIGGHFDSVVDAGRYDGTLGVLSGIAAVEAIRNSGRTLPFAVEVVAIIDEEGNRFHTSFLGSTPLAGIWDTSWLDLADDDGVLLADAIRAGGGDPDALSGDAYRAGEVVGFIEVHIEQGPVLQDRDLPVAAVSSITGRVAAKIEFAGMAGHAGTVPMPLRRDALAAGAELVLAVERIGRSVPNLVATIGELDVSPGASNVIAGRVDMTLDLRHPDPGIRDTAFGEIRSAAEEIAKRRKLDLVWADTPGFAETPCDSVLTGLLTSAIEAEGIEAIDLFSGAGHDAVTMATVAPVTMMFVRCLDGVSHNPAESIVIYDVEVALRVLDRFLMSIAAER